jgi:hypothetical protein
MLENLEAPPGFEPRRNWQKWARFRYSGGTCSANVSLDEHHHVVLIGHL